MANVVPDMAIRSDGGHLKDASKIYADELTHCQYDVYVPTVSSCAVAITRLGCANYRVPSIVSNDANFLHRDPDGRLNGFTWDLLAALKDTLGFNYTLSLQADGIYGGTDAAGNWNGMIGELIGSRTDMVIAQLTLTAQRQTVIDFTVPFMPFHLTVLTLANASLTGIKYAVKTSSAEFTYLLNSKETGGQETWTSIQANLPASIVPNDNGGVTLVRQGGWAYVTGDATIARTVSESNGQLVIHRPALQTFYFGLGLPLGSISPSETAAYRATQTQLKGIHSRATNKMEPCHPERHIAS